MGNAAQQPLTEPEVRRDLQALCDAAAPQDRRRPAFLRLREHFAPVTSAREEFAAELRRVFGLRFQRWPSPPSGAWPAERGAALADCIRGCLYGAALGDAAGLATEFLPRKTVLEHYGEDFDFRPGCEVFADSHRMSFPAGDWTDDTDQLLIILQTLLESGGKAVLEHPDFEASPASAARAVWEKTGRKGAANGAVMRTAVTGIPFFWDMATVRENTRSFCEATHADPRCLASCAVVADCIAQLLQAAASGVEADVEQLLEAGVLGAEAMLADSEESCADLRRHADAQSLEELRLDEPRGIGYTLKCLGCGTWALRHGAELGFEEAVRQVVLQGGDADTNACVAGALLGCHLGYGGLPQRWIGGMPYVAWLEAWVQKLLYMLQLPVVAKVAAH